MNQELIDKHREINVDYDGWWESVYEWFEEECNARGVNILSHQETSQHGNKPPTSRMVRDIIWSGFWSQGDGAAFAGSVVDMRKALGSELDKYPMLQKYLELDGWYKCIWTTTRRNNIDYLGLETEYIWHYLDEGEEHPFAEVWQEQLEAELELVEAELGDLANDLCDLLYKALRDEYDALTTDEAVWETIVANELDKEVA